MKNLKVFQNVNEYESGLTIPELYLILPSVSYISNTKKVKYNPRPIVINENTLYYKHPDFFGVEYDDETETMTINKNNEKYKGIVIGDTLYL